MSVDDLSKLMISMAVTFAIVVIAFGLFRILNNLASTISDLRKAVQNTSAISDLILEDYTNIREKAYSILSDLTGTILEPLSLFLKLFGAFRGFFVGKDKDSSEE